MSHIRLVGDSSDAEFSPKLKEVLARLEAEVEQVQTEIEKTGVVHSADAIPAFSPNGELVVLVKIYYSIEEVVGMADRIQGVSIREKYRDTEPPPDPFTQDYPDDFLG